MVGIRLVSAKSMIRARCVFASAGSHPLPHAAPPLVPAFAREQGAEDERGGEREDRERKDRERQGHERQGRERQGKQERAQEHDQGGGGEGNEERDEEREEERVLLGPAADLYGHLLFHTGVTATPRSSACRHA